MCKTIAKTKKRLGRSLPFWAYGSTQSFLETVGIRWDDNNRIFCIACRANLVSEAAIAHGRKSRREWSHLSESTLYPLTAMWSWSHYLTSLNLSFPSCELEIAWITRNDLDYSDQVLSFILLHKCETIVSLIYVAIFPTFSLLPVPG